MEVSILWNTLLYEKDVVYNKYTKLYFPLSGWPYTCRGGAMYTLEKKKIYTLIENEMLN